MDISAPILTDIQPSTSVGERDSDTESISLSEVENIVDEARQHKSINEGNESDEAIRRTQLLSVDAMSVLLDSVEKKENELTELRAQLQSLQDHADYIIEENSTLRSRMFDALAERDQEIDRLRSKQQTVENSSPRASAVLSLSTDEKDLMEKSTSLESDLVIVRKMNLLIKQKNIKLGELVIRRDAEIVKQRKEIERLSSELKSHEDVNIDREELQRSNRIVKEEAMRQTNEIREQQQMALAVRQELARCRQEKLSIEKDYFRVECALRKSNDSMVSLQQTLSETVERRNSLAILNDDLKREVHLHESRSIDAMDKLNRVQLDLEAEKLQRNHWESLMRSETDRYQLLLQEHAEMRQSYQNLFIRYMEVKSDNIRLQRQCEHFASDAELARASVLTYKGYIHKNEKSLDDLLQENVYLTGMLKQKEGQMEEVDRRWKKQFIDAIHEIADDDIMDNNITDENKQHFTEVNPPSSTYIPSTTTDRGGYSYPLPSNHPFVTSKSTPKSMPLHPTAPILSHTPILPSSEQQVTPVSESTLQTQTLSTFISDTNSAQKSSNSSSLSFDDALSNVMKQTEELKRMADYYEYQD